MNLVVNFGFCRVVGLSLAKTAVVVYILHFLILVKSTFHGKIFLYMTFAARPLSREITMSQAYQNMCAGMYKVSDVLWIVIVKITFFKKK